MGDDKVEFKWLEAKCVGGNVVMFRLEDGAQVKVTVELDRAGVAIDQVGADGMPMYNLNFSNKANVIPANRKYSVPKTQLGVDKVTPAPTDGKAPYG